MFDSKFLFTLIGLVLTVLAICNFNTDKVHSSLEGFGMLPSMTWKVDRQMASSRQAAEKGDFYSVPGTFQAILNPRFSNTDYGANIKYNMPSLQNQAVPCEPLTFGNMARENYTKEKYGCGSCGGGCGPVRCQKDGSPLRTRVGATATPAGWAAGNFNQVRDAAYSASEYQEATDMIPVGDMTTFNALGETVQPIVYDRFIYANRNSRLRSLGDPIRGDLPIVPRSGEWFNVSVHPNIDLQEGAMNVMGGTMNETSNALSTLIHASSGKADTVIGGVNMANQFSGNLSGGMRDVSITAFP